MSFAKTGSEDENFFHDGNGAGEFNGILRRAKYTWARLKMLRLVGRTVRRMVWETAMDNTTVWLRRWPINFFSLSPRPSFLWHLLGLFGDRSSQIASHVCHPERIFAAGSEGQDILDSALSPAWCDWLARMDSTGIIRFISAPCLSARFRAPQSYARRVEGPHWWSNHHFFFLLFWFGLTISLL